MEKDGPSEPRRSAFPASGADTQGAAEQRPRGEFSSKGKMICNSWKSHFYKHCINVSGSSPAEPQVLCSLSFFGEAGILGRLAEGCSLLIVWGTH